MGIPNRALSIIRNEKTLFFSIILALLSMLFVHPDASYADYFDVRVLCLLFCLMAVVLGLQDCGVFKVMAQKLLSGEKGTRTLFLALILLPFFCSMLVTNDVALLTFVPFTILVLDMVDRRDALVRTIVLQTIAANVGCMITPFGSPHNLYLYSFYAIPAGSFFKIMLPVSLAGLLCLSLAVFFEKKGTIAVKFENCEHIRDKKRFIVFCLLFGLSLLSVFRVVSYWIPTAAVFLCMLVFSPRLLKKVNYPLLLTFVCFFVFAGNLGRIPQVSGFLSMLMNKNTVLSSVLASQVISNVPASVLLSKFTGDWKSMLVGINIGGLGTPIASLASIISFDFYVRTENARPLYFLGIFMLFNLLTMLVLFLASLLI